MCDIFRKISIKMVGILKKNIWERLEGKHQLSEDSSLVQNISLPSSTGSKDAGRGIKRVKAPSEHVRGDALRLAIARLTSQGKARKVTDKSYIGGGLKGGTGRGGAGRCCWRPGKRTFFLRPKGRHLLVRTSFHTPRSSRALHSADSKCMIINIDNLS